LIESRDDTIMSNRTPRPDVNIDHLRSRQSELRRRLSDGDEQISGAKRAGADTTRWEDHWITLLREYESVCRALGEYAPDQFPAAA
jgi:hypothetical protein